MDRFRRVVIVVKRMLLFFFSSGKYKIGWECVFDNKEYREMVFGFEREEIVFGYFEEFLRILMRR